MDAAWRSHWKIYVSPLMMLLFLIRNGDRFMAASPRSVATRSPSPDPSP